MDPSSAYSWPVRSSSRRTKANRKKNHTAPATAAAATTRTISTAQPHITPASFPLQKGAAPRQPLSLCDAPPPPYRLVPSFFSPVVFHWTKAPAAARAMPTTHMSSGFPR